MSDVDVKVYPNLDVVIIRRSDLRLAVNHTWKVSNRYGYFEGMAYLLVYALLMTLGSALPMLVCAVIFAAAVLVGRLWAEKLAAGKRKEIYEIIGVGVGNE